MVFKFVALCALVACAHAGIVGVGGGTSVSSRVQDEAGNYAFKYQIVDGLGATNGRAEAGSKHGVVGTYNLGDIDGRVRHVEYVADGAGFRAKIATNEPGTAPSLPASAVIDSTNAVGVVGSPAAAHVVAAPIVAAPIVKAVGYGHDLAGVGAYGHGLAGVGAYGHGLAGVGAYGHGLAGVGAYGHGLAGVGPYGVGAYGAHGLLGGIGHGTGYGRVW